MRKTLVVALSVLLVSITSGCYHAVIETASPAGNESIEVLWAHSFLYGLVPPNVVDSADDCPSGVAQVETQHSFLNGLAAALTFGIYTPLQINVTCASGAASIDLPTVRNLAEAKARRDAGEAFLLPLRVLEVAE